MHENIRIKAAFLVVAADQVYKNTGLRIRNGRGTEIVPNEMEDETEEVVDCTKDIVCPSFSDMHTHLYSTLLKNVALPKVSLVENLRTFWWPRLENRQTIGTIRDAVAFGVYQHLRSGYTFVNDILEAPLAEKGKRLQTEKDIFVKTGMKGILALESNERISRENGLECLYENREFEKENKQNRNVHGAICTHTVFSSGKEFLLYASEIAEKQEALFQFHMNEGPEENAYCRKKYGMGTTEFYEASGCWKKGMKIFANQCSSLSNMDMKIMQKYHVGIASNPQSNALEGSGIADIEGMLSNDLKVSLGTDAGEGNPFELMRLMFLMQRGLLGFTKNICEQNIFRIATENGPRAVEFCRTGKLEAGYDADFLVLRNDSPLDLDEQDILSEIIWNMNPENIKAVYSNGICRVKQGHVVGLDEEKLLSDFKMAHMIFWKK